MDILKASVILNTINEDRNLLSIAIESYLNQTNVEVELIISSVEGDINLDFVRSKYPSCKIVTMPRSEHPIGKGIKEPKGSFMQLNNALKHITGDWFVFASGNDFAYSDKLSMEINSCIETGTEVCYSSYDYVNHLGRRKKAQLFHDYDFKKHMVGNFVSDCAVVSRRLVDKYLPFKIELNNYAYWDLWLRIYEGEGNVFCYNKNPTWAYRQEDSSMHLQRKKDQNKINQAKKDRETMLNQHR